MCMTSVHGTTKGSAYAIWLAMLCGTSTKMGHGCTSCPISMRSLRSQPLSNALRLKNKTKEQHECTNLMHSDLVALNRVTHTQRAGYFSDGPTRNHRSWLTPQPRWAGFALLKTRNRLCLSPHEHYPNSNPRNGAFFARQGAIVQSRETRVRLLYP